MSERRDVEFMAALYEAEEAASVAHDAIYAEPFDQKAASDAIWVIHNALRPLLDDGEPDLCKRIDWDKERMLNDTDAALRTYLAAARCRPQEQPK
jgi:hypothetical protein